MTHKITNDCKMCGSCQTTCPRKAIRKGNPYYIDPRKCIDCGLCIKACPFDAIISGN